MIIMSLGKKDLRSLKLAFEQLLFTAMQFFVWFGKEFISFQVKCLFSKGF